MCFSENRIGLKMVSEYISRLRTLLEGQQLVETKILLDRIKTESDITELIVPQWLPLVTNTSQPAVSRMVCFVKSTKPVGLGSVLLNQERLKNISEYLSR